MLKGSEYNFQFYKQIETQTQKIHEIFKGVAMIILSN